MIWRCLFVGHDWQTYQHGFWIDHGSADVVIAFKVCRRCAKSKLIHILK